MTGIAVKLASSDPARQMSVAEIMGRLGCEMRQMAGVVEDLEVLIGNLIIAGGIKSSSSLFQLQKLDRLRQELAGLAEYADGVGRLSLSHWKVDAAEAAHFVTLLELSDRLVHDRGQPSGASDTPGECELFE